MADPTATPGVGAPGAYEANLAQQPTVLRGLVERRRLATGALRAFLATAPRRPVRKVYLVGSGTSRYAAEIAAPVFADLLGVDAEAVATLVFLNDVPAARLGSGTVVVGVSQSGETLALVEGLTRASAHGSPTVAVTDDPDSGLARAADAAVLSLTGAEAVYAKTKGFLTTALAACLAAAEFSGPDDAAGAARRATFDATLDLLPGHASRVIEAATDAAPRLARRFADVGALAVVGSGRLLPAAHEGALKLLEVAKLIVAPYELEESMHGPFNAFGPHTGLVLLAGAIPQAMKLAAFREAASAIGAPLIDIADVEPADLVVPRLPYAALEPLLGVLPLQALASELARVRGVNPDATRYPSLYAVFRTKTGHAHEPR